ncbi:MAG: TIGR03905 family TSCPD domain-containing protein [Endomicrobiaceae bacterium]|nr:TIGR03905 family TSCPD domain-containing protein [Endomicrobiaceae bacterium]
MKTYTVNTHGICAMQISFSLDKGNIYNIKFLGGCPGNTSALSKVLEGTSAQRIVDLLKGNDCDGKGTSCADQLARGVEKALLEG